MLNIKIKEIKMISLATSISRILLIVVMLMNAILRYVTYKAGKTLGIISLILLIVNIVMTILYAIFLGRALMDFSNELKAAETFNLLVIGLSLSIVGYFGLLLTEKKINIGMVTNNNIAPNTNPQGYVANTTNEQNEPIEVVADEINVNKK